MAMYAFFFVLPLSIYRVCMCVRVCVFGRSLARTRFAEGRVRTLETVRVRATNLYTGYKYVCALVRGCEV